MDERVYRLIGICRVVGGFWGFGTGAEVEASGIAISTDIVT